MAARTHQAVPRAEWTPPGQRRQAVAPSSTRAQQRLTHSRLCACLEANACLLFISWLFDHSTFCKHLKGFSGKAVSHGRYPGPSVSPSLVLSPTLA